MMKAVVVWAAFISLTIYQMPSKTDVKWMIFQSQKVVRFLSKANLFCPFFLFLLLICTSFQSPLLRKKYERCWTFVSLISIWTTLNAMECDSSVDFFFLSRRCLRPESQGKFDSFLIMFCSSFNQVIKDNLSLNGLWHFLKASKAKLNLKDHFVRTQN